MEGGGANKWKFIETGISKGSDRITLKTAYENIFIPENPQTFRL